MSEATKINTMLRYFRVTSYITGSMLILVMILWFYRGVLGQELWAFGPHGLLAFETRGVDDLGLPNAGFSLTKMILIVHGWLYVAYLYGDFQLFTNLRWGITRFLIIALGGVIPLLSFFTERHFHKLANSWQVGTRDSEHQVGRR